MTQVLILEQLAGRPDKQLQCLHSLCTAIAYPSQLSADLHGALAVLRWRGGLLLGERAGVQSQGFHCLPVILHDVSKSGVRGR